MLIPMNVHGFFLLAASILLYATAFVRSPDGAVHTVKLSVSSSPVDPSDVVNLDYLDTRLNTLPCKTFMRMSGALPGCPTDFSPTTGGTCEVLCVNPDFPFPAADNFTCTAAGWDAEPECNDVAPSCEAAVATFGPGVRKVRDFGEIYCDAEGFAVFMSSRGSSFSGEMYHNPTTTTPSAGFTLGNMGVPSPTKPSGMLKFSHIPANTPLKFMCSVNSGSSWTSYELPGGFDDYTPGDKGAHSGYWGTIAVANEYTRHANSICGPSVSTTATMSGLALCANSPVGWTSVVAGMWSTSSQQYLGCNEQSVSYNSDIARFMFLAKI